MDKGTEASSKMQDTYWCPHLYYKSFADDRGFYTTLDNVYRLEWNYCPTCGKKRPDHVAA